MRFLKLGCIAPHAPILIPDIAGSEIKTIDETEKALSELADEIEVLNPETVIAISPGHISLGHRGAFEVKAGERVTGSMARFRAPHIVPTYETDLELTDAIAETAADSGIQVAADRSEEENDWGILVPLYMLAPLDCKLVSFKISPYLPYSDHYRLGTAIREATEKTERGSVFIASGDLSHRLTRGAPSGYNPRGKEFDSLIVDIVDSADFSRLFTIEHALIDAAGEDCVWSISALAGIMDGYSVDSNVLSYEGPFGVGYMVASVRPGEPDQSRRLSPG